MSLFGDLWRLVFARLPLPQRAAMRAVCKAWMGHLDVRSMWQDMPLEGKLRRFQRMCIKSRPCAARWLQNVFGFAADDIRGNGSLAVPGLTGSMVLMQWFALAFSVTAEDVCKCGALYVLCGSGKLEMAAWLVAHCGITAQDLCGPRGCCVPKIGPTMPGVEEWIRATFGLTAQGLLSHEECVPMFLVLSHEERVPISLSL
jgi:hypothetical protein